MLTMSYYQMRCPACRPIRNRICTALSAALYTANKRDAEFIRRSNRMCEAIVNNSTFASVSTENFFGGSSSDANICLKIAKSKLLISSNLFAKSVLKLHKGRHLVDKLI